MLVEDDGEREWGRRGGGGGGGRAGEGKCGRLAEWSGYEKAGECLRS